MPSNLDSMYRRRLVLFVYSFSLRVSDRRLIKQGSNCKLRRYRHRVDQARLDTGARWRLAIDISPPSGILGFC
eukprot:6185067-Pleurochrysis_carterae.AAC.2